MSEDKISRRKYIASVGAAAAVGVAVGAGGYYLAYPPAKGAEPIVMANWGGKWQESVSVIGRQFTEQYGNPVLQELQGTSGEVLPKIRTPWPDVNIDVAATANTIALQLAKEGFTAPLEDLDIPNLANVPESMKVIYDGHTAAVGWYGHGWGLCWRNDKIQDPVTGFGAMYRPELKGQCALPSYSMGPARPLILLSMYGCWKQGLKDVEYVEYIDTIGFDEAKALAETGNVRYVWGSVTESQRLMATGDASLTPLHSQSVFRAQGVAEPPGSISVVKVPDDMPIAVTFDTVCIIDGPRKDIAAKWLDFFLDKPNIEYTCSEIGAIPANIKADTNPDLAPWAPTPAEVEEHGYNPDSDIIMENADKWGTRWEQEILPLLG